MSDGSAFSNAFMGAYQMMMQREKEEQDKKDLMKSYAAFAGVNDPPMSTTSPVTQQTQVPVAIGAIPGQNGNTQEPSAPVQAPQTQMQTETFTTQKEDPWKAGKAAIQNAYTAKIKQGLPQMTDPKIAAQFIHQATTERDMAFMQHNSDSFQSELSGLMTDDSKTPTQKAAIAFSLNSKYKIGLKPNEILGMFEAKGPQTQVIGRGGALVDNKGNILYQNEMQYAPRGGGGGGGGSRTTYDDDGNPVAKPGKVATSPLDQWAFDYEKKGKYIEDQAIYDAYMNSEAATPEMEVKALEAKGRLMQYWKMQGNGNPPASRPSLSEILK